MASDGSAPPTAPRKSYPENQLGPSYFVHVLSSLSFCFSSEGCNSFEENYQVVELQSKVVIPFEAFLAGMGVPESTLDARRDPLKAIASSNGPPQASVTVEVQRHESFHELVNLFSRLSRKTIILTWVDSELVEGPFAASGPRRRLPIVMAAIRQHEHDRFLVGIKTYDNTCFHDPEIDRFAWPPSGVSSSSQSFKLLCDLSDSREDSPRPSHASDDESSSSSSSSVSSPACVNACKSADEDTPSPSTAHANSPSGPGPGKPAALEPFYPIPSSGWGKRLRQEMSSKTGDMGHRSKLARIMKDEDEDEEGPFKDLEIDCIRNVIKLMWSTPGCRHVYQLLVADGKLLLGYYDRAVAVFSESFSYTEKARMLEPLLQGLAEMSVRDAGFLEDVKRAEGPVEEIFDALAQYADLNQSVCNTIEELESERPLHTLKLDDSTVANLICEVAGRPRYAWTGRGTSVFLCYLVSPGKRGSSALKLSWPQARRDSEVEVLRKTRAVLRNMDAEPEHRQLYSDRVLADLLPSAMTSKDLDDLKRERSFRWATEEYYKKPDLESNHICRAAAMEFLRPLHSVTSLDHFKSGIRDIVLAHHFLCVSEEQILHRDITPYNLMVRYYPGTDKICGVLIDFDLELIDPPSSVGYSGKRTGNRLFMSAELLEPVAPIHLERFDWESFLYAICWIGSHFSYGDEVETDAFAIWDEPNDSMLRVFKGGVLIGYSPTSLYSLFTEFYQSLISSWIRPLQRIFRDGNDVIIDFRPHKRDRPEDDLLVFDEETLGGQVTWQRFWGILEQ